LGGIPANRKVVKVAKSKLKQFANKVDLLIPCNCVVVAGDSGSCVRHNILSAQHRLHLTAFGVGMLAFLAGFGICWLAFVR